MKSKNQSWLTSFIEESNKIEGITRKPTQAEYDTFARFLYLDSISIVDLQKFVSVYQPGARLRDSLGMDVRIGSYLPPLGGPRVQGELAVLLVDLKDNWPIIPPYLWHCKYEALHPFTDGNGRSGRALWAWQMRKLGYDFKLGFLHKFYYQSLIYQNQTVANLVAAMKAAF